MPVLLAAFIAFGVSKQAALDTSVDFTCPATRAEVVLRQLSQKAGVNLRASGDVASDVLVIRVHSVPLRDLMSRLAAAASARWTQSGDAFYLAPSREAEQAHHHTLARELSAGIQTALDAKLNSPAMKTEWSEAEAMRLANQTETAMDPTNGTIRSDNKAVQALMGRAPATRTLVSLLAQVGAEELADRVADGRIVYSTDATPMQIAMSPSRDILDQFLTEQVQFVDATKNVLSGRPPSNSYVSISGVDRGVIRGGDPAGGVGKALLSVTGSYRDHRIQAHMTITDRAGKTLGESDLDLKPDPPALKLFPPKGDDTPIPTDKIAKELWEASRVGEASTRSTMSMMTSNGGHSVRLDLRPPPPIRKTVPSNALIKWVSSPLENEPLRLSIGNQLSATAERRTENLVADLDDRSFDVMAAPISPSALLSGRSMQELYDLSEEAGWLTVNLRDPVAARKARISRNGLQTLVTALLKKHILSLGDISQFAQTQDAAPEGGTFDYEYIRVLCPGITIDSYDFGWWPVYRFFGALTGDQLDDLARGSVINVATLTPAAEAALKRLVVEDWSPPTISDSSGKEVDTYGDGIVTEWTEVLPNGVPPNTLVSAKIESQPAAYCFSSQQGVADIESAADLGREQFIDQSQRFREYASGVAFDRYAPARLASYKFHLAFSFSVSLNPKVKDGIYDGSPAPGSFAEMPPDLKKAIADELGALKSAFGNAGFGTPTRTSLPP